MALEFTLNDTSFGVGDIVKVTQKIKEGEKERLQTFTGVVIRIKGRGENKSFTVRRVGVQKIGIERIFPVQTPSIVNIEIVRRGKEGVKKSKLYYIRDKSRKEIEKIFQRASKRQKIKKTSKKNLKK